MEDVEREEIEEHLPSTIDWLDRNAVQRYVKTPEGVVVVDRAFDLACLVRNALIRESVRLRSEKPENPNLDSLTRLVEYAEKTQEPDRHGIRMVPISTVVFRRLIEEAKERP